MTIIVVKNLALYCNTCCDSMSITLACISGKKYICDTNITV